MSDTPEALSDFPSSNHARRSAESAVAGVAMDPDMTELIAADLGAPVLVHTVTGTPSYWLVPLRSGPRAIGFVRVTATGTVGAVGRYGGTSALDLDAADVGARASEHLAEGESGGEPVLVHDGPAGREAWMVVTTVHGAPARRLFVTPAGFYERSAGEH